MCRISCQSVTVFDVCDWWGVREIGYLAFLMLAVLNVGAYLINAQLFYIALQLLPQVQHVAWRYPPLPTHISCLLAISSKDTRRG